MIFILCDNSKTLFYIKVYRYPERFSNSYVADFFKRSVLKEAHNLRYLRKNITMLISKFKNKVYTFEISLADLFFRFCFVTVPNISL